MTLKDFIFQQVTNADGLILTSGELLNSWKKFKGDDNFRGDSRREFGHNGSLHKAIYALAKDGKLSYRDNRGNLLVRTFTKAPWWEHLKLKDGIEIFKCCVPEPEGDMIDVEMIPKPDCVLFKLTDKVLSVSDKSINLYNFQHGTMPIRDILGLVRKLNELNIIKI